MDAYHQLLERKATRTVYGGFDADHVNSELFDFQSAIVKIIRMKDRILMETKIDQI